MPTESAADTITAVAKPLIIGVNRILPNLTMLSLMKIIGSTLSRAALLALREMKSRRRRSRLGYVYTPSCRGWYASDCCSCNFCYDGNPSLCW